MTTEKGGRPIGKRIRQLCAAVEKGARNSLEVAADTNIPSNEICRYARRAEYHGLLTVDRTPRLHTYTVVPGWQHLLVCPGRPVVVVIARPVRHVRIQPLPVNSVFQLGERAGGHP